MQTVNLKRIDQDVLYDAENERYFTFVADANALSNKIFRKHKGCVVAINDVVIRTDTEIPVDGIIVTLQKEEVDESTGLVIETSRMDIVSTRYIGTFASSWYLI